MAEKNSVKKVVLAYSGGLDTSIILKWLGDNYGCEVVTFTADIGQNEDLAPVREKALKLGIKAENIFIEDLREEFVRDYVFPMFRANAIYEGEYLLGTSIARPLIAKRLVEIAKKTKADAISHGATGKGNDQVRFELGAYALKPDIKVIAPWREWDLNSREKLLAYAGKHGIEIAKKKGKSPYSMDANLLHISYEGLVLEDPNHAPEDDMWRWTTDPKKAPNKSEIIEIEYKNGDPVALNGKKLKPHEMLNELNNLGAKHGIGRLDIVENRFVGMKSRGCYETPGGTIIHLKAENFFNAQKFPEMRFVSKKFVFDGDKVKSVEGDLTLLGQTKPVVLEATKFNCYHNKMANKQACGGDFKTQIKPTEWGFKMPQDAKIKIQVEAFKD